MRNMKDSKIDWIGKIPEGWKLKRLKHIFEERKEKNSPIRSKDILSLSIERGIFPYSEKTGGGNKAKENLEDYKLAYPNDIVLNSMNVVVGSVGKSNYFGCVSPVYYTLFVRNNNYNVDYYNYIFQSNAFQKSLWGLGNGIVAKESNNGKLNTIRMRIPMEKLNNVIIPIPNTTEQENIANYIDKKVDEIDNAIEKTKQTISDYKLYKQSIITRAITKGLNRNTEMKDSGLDFVSKIPKHWNIKKIRYLGTLQNGISKSGDYFGEYDYPFVNYGDVYNNYELPKKYNNCVNSSESDRELYSVKRGDVFFTRTSETIEEVGFTATCIEDVDKAVFSGFLIRFRPNNINELHPEYSKYYFRSDIHRKFFVKEMNIVTRASLGQDLLKKLPVILPSIEEQKKIASYLNEKCSDIDEVIEEKEKIIKELENYRKSLIYEYVTGKKEVKTNYNSNTEMAELSLRIIEQLPNNYSMCKIKLNKIQSVILKMIKYKKEPNYEKYVAGPYSKELMNNVYDIFERNKWIKINKDGMRDVYLLDENYEEGIKEYNKHFKDYDNEIIRIIKLFEKKDTQESEIIATLFYCWNDYLIEGIQPTDKQIIDQFYNWSKRKKNIEITKVRKCLKYMKNNNLIPNGYGKKTITKVV